MTEILVDYSIEVVDEYFFERGNFENKGLSLSREIITV